MIWQVGRSNSHALPYEKKIQKKSLSNFMGNLSGQEESGESLSLFMESFSHDIYLNSFSNSFE